ncbi:MAG: glycine cleavage system H protein [Glomeribacter sp. 1016415]|uniref:Glycine cleavage system H protein n=1 Tax=Linnemannia elongata AG-77 TaxID=1314771 RepID=A0A197JBN5_9FUNG|nr:glycine cleavage system H protein [Glomeribacter sp. 1016415]OAQ21921.1 glycine cleavage system protein H [Linnemannia elongata AG-77]
MKLPADLKYTASHEWVRVEPDGVVTIGITDHAQEALGDIVFLELPTEGTKIAAGKALAVIESVKAASDIYAPISGEILEINEQLADEPGAVNADPYAAWLLKMKPSSEAEFASLMDAEAYRQSIGS